MALHRCCCCLFLLLLSCWCLMPVGSALRTAAACLACRATPVACPLRSGLFTRPQLPHGLNPVTTVPRGACNLNISEMAPSTNHLALRTPRDGRYVLKGGRGSRPGEHHAAGTTFSYTHGGLSADGTRHGEVIWAPGPLTEPIEVMLLVKQSNPGIQYQYNLPKASKGDGVSGGAVTPWGAAPVTEEAEEVAWRVAGFTPCSLSCGGGEQQSVLACMRGLHATLPPSHCDHLTQPEEVTVRCNTKPCPAQWEAGDWSSCSASCGSGTQTRAIICRQFISPLLTVKVAEGACLGSPPERSQRCHVRPCHVEAELTWAVGEWGGCSAPCGHGLRTRRVWCSGDQGVEFPDLRCAEMERPHSEEPCQVAPCPQVGPQVLHHGPQAASLLLHHPTTSRSRGCSASCGPGILQRRLHCAAVDDQETDDNDVVNEEEEEGVCDSRKKPSDTRPCHSEEGCGTAWFHGPWDQCPDSCEEGAGAQQSRSVVCVQRTRAQSRVVQDARCAALERPAQRRACPQPLEACSRATWFIGQWGQCEGGCGHGQRTRDVRCLMDSSGVPSEDCSPERRPHTSERCEPEHCTPPADFVESRHRAGMGRAAVSSSAGPAHCGPPKLRNCGLVVQARLCHYPYYRRACCAACARHETDHPHAE